jgi:hypothetical protein
MKGQKKLGGLLPTAAILVLGIIYLASVAAVFAVPVDLQNDRAMQYLVHITTLLTAFVNIFFVSSICAREGDSSHGRLALLFAALMSIPILLGRGIGIAALSDPGLSSYDSVLNFYAPTSVTRITEVFSWTVLFPFSMLFLAILFFKKRDKTLPLALTALLSSACCFVGFLSMFYPDSVFLYIGMTGWGVLFFVFALLYLVRLIRKGRAKTAG